MNTTELIARSIQYRRDLQGISVAVVSMHTAAGSQDEILNHYGMSPAGLTTVVKRLMEDI
jgi:hypothetical protein